MTMHLQKLSVGSEGIDTLPAELRSKLTDLGAW